MKHIFLSIFIGLAIFCQACATGNASTSSTDLTQLCATLNQAWQCANVTPPVTCEALFQSCNANDISLAQAQASCFLSECKAGTLQSKGSAACPDATRAYMNGMSQACTESQKGISF